MPKLCPADLVAYTTLTLSPVLVFGTYIGVTMTSNGDLDASRLFTSLILINLLASPLIHILQLLPSFGAAKGCFARLRAFLEKSELIDYRQTQPGRRQDPDSPKDQALKDDKFLQETGSAECPDDIALAVEKAQFGWTTDPFLNEITLEIRKGEHVAITGPVGCGKSLLLKAILGEVECISGSVRVGTSRIGYCGQETWLENITVLENAFRCAPEDVPWRQKVVDSCALNDLARSQSPSETIGSNGTKISGGERQRLVCST